MSEVLPEGRCPMLEISGQGPGNLRSPNVQQPPATGLTCQKGRRDGVLAVGPVEIDGNQPDLPKIGKLVPGFRWDTRLVGRTRIHGPCLRLKWPDPPWPGSTVG